VTRSRIALGPTRRPEAQLEICEAIRSWLTRERHPEATGGVRRGRTSRRDLSEFVSPSPRRRDATPARAVADQDMNMLVTDVTIVFFRADLRELCVPTATLPRIEVRLPHARENLRDNPSRATPPVKPPWQLGNIGSPVDGVFREHQADGSRLRIDALRDPSEGSAAVLRITDPRLRRGIADRNPQPLSERVEEHAMEMANSVRRACFFTRKAEHRLERAAIIGRGPQVNRIRMVAVLANVDRIRACANCRELTPTGSEMENGTKRKGEGGRKSPGRPIRRPHDAVWADLASGVAHFDENVARSCAHSSLDERIFRSLPSKSPRSEVVPRLPQSAVPVEPPDVAGGPSDHGNRVRTHASACGDAH